MVDGVSGVTGVTGADGPDTWPPGAYVEGWLHGWVASRRTPPPTRVEGAWRIETGDPARESRRYLLDPTHVDPEVTVAGLLAAPQPPLCCIKLAGERDAWLPRFPAPWVPDPPCWFMLRQLAPAQVPEVPPGYRVEVTTPTPTLVAVAVTADDGAPAARGQVGLGPSYAVPDRIVTEPDHRRRGLGSVVMARLEAAALAAGRTRAVLGATEAGRELYLSLGWYAALPQLGVYHRP